MNNLDSTFVPEEERYTFWDWFRDLPWGVILGWLLVLGIIGSAIFWAVKTNVDFKNDCHRRGGHVVEIRDDDKICVDDEWRVLIRD
jgi:hypothetical protein